MANILKAAGTTATDGYSATRLNHWKLENTFWLEKKKLIQDFDEIRKLDHYVINVPAEYKVPVEVSPEELVEYLTRPAKSQVEKLRVLVRWVADNVAYDVEYLQDESRGIDSSMAGVLRTGKAICAGYANLVTELCNIADIECVTVSGISKAAGYYPGSINTENPNSDHAWNIVTLNGDKFFVEATWAAGGTSDNRGVFNKRWNEWYFLTDPEQHLSEHLPLIKNTVDTKTQLVEDPYEDVRDWDDMVVSDPAAVFFGVKASSDPYPFIQTDHSEYIMDFENPHHMEVFSRINQIQQNGNVRRSSQLDDKLHTMVYTSEGITKVHIRFPSNGQYEIHVLGRIPSADADLQEANSVFTVARYSVEFSGETALPGFPRGINNVWGAQPEFLAAGFKILSPESPVIEANDGKAEIKVKLPTPNGLHAVFNLETGSNLTSMGCHNNVHVEVNDDVATYYIYSPTAGEFRFTLNYNFNGGNSYKEGVAFLIKSQSAAENPFRGNSNTESSNSEVTSCLFDKMGLASGWISCIKNTYTITTHQT